MAEERVDIVITDKVSKGPEEKLLALAAAARSANGLINSLKTELAGINNRSIAKLQDAMVSMTVMTTRQEMALERLRGATARADAATASATLAQQRATTEAERTALMQARLTTEQERLVAVGARVEATKARQEAASVRAAAGMERENDAAVKLYLQTEKLRAVDRATGSQAAYNAQLGVAEPTSGSARASAAVFLADAQAKDAAARATDNLTARANALRVAVDPLYAATQRFDREMLEANALLAAGAINQTTYAQATTLATAAMNQQTGASKKMNDQTKLTRFQLLTLQYTINDVIASLASGASPMTIFMQQGGQVTQAWGGALNTLRALGAFLERPIGLFAVLASTVAGGLLVVDQARREYEGIGRQLALTGGSAGLTAGQFVGMANDIAKASNSSVASSREVALQYSKSGQLQRQEVERLTITTENFAKLSNESTDKVVKSFEGMIEGPTKFAREFALKYNTITTAQYEYIKLLEDSGRKSEAVTATAKILYDYYGKEATTALGYLETAWNAVGKAISNAYTAAKDFGRQNTIQEQVELAQRSVNDLQALAARNVNVGIGLGVGGQSSKDRLQDAQAALTIAKEGAKFEQQAALSRATSAEQNRKAVEGVEALSKYSAEIADNSAKAEIAIKKFRQELADVGRVNPQSAEYLNALKNQAAIEKGIREKFMPDQKKTDKQAETAAQARILAMSAINAELNKELSALGKVGPEREAQLKTDEIAIQLGRKKITLSEQEFAAIFRKVSAIQQDHQLQLALNQAYNDAVGPLNAYVNAQQAASLLFEKNLITGAEMLRQQAVAKMRYLDTIDPLRQMNRSLDEQARLLGLVGVAREKEAARIQAENAERAREGDVITAAMQRDIDAYALRTVALQRQGKITAELNTIYDDSVGKLDAITIKQVALNQAMERGYIGLNYYNQAMTKLRSETFAAKQAIGADNFFDRVSESFDKNIQNMEDKLVDFVMTAKFDFKSLVQSMLADLARLEIRRQVMAPLQGQLAEAGGFGGLLKTGLGALMGAFSGGVPTGAQFAANDTAGLADAWALEAFDKGTPYVPYDQIAMIHQGEKITTAADNAAGGGNSKGGFVYAPVFAPQIDSRSDAAAIRVEMKQQFEAYDALQKEQFRRMGWIDD